MLHTPVTPDIQVVLHSHSLVPLTYQKEAQSPDLPLSILPVTNLRGPAYLANPGGMCIPKLWYYFPGGRYTLQLLNLWVISPLILNIKLQNFLLHLRNNRTDGSSFHLLLTGWHPVLPSSITSQEQVTLNGFLPFPLKRKCGWRVECSGIDH